MLMNSFHLDFSFDLQSSPTAFPITEPGGALGVDVEEIMPLYSGATDIPPVLKCHDYRPSLVWTYHRCGSSYIQLVATGCPTKVPVVLGPMSAGMKEV